MGMYSAEAPPPRDYGKETRETLEAQIELAPDLFAAEASQEYGRPAEARLNLQVLRDLMRGSEGQPGLLELYERDIMPGLARADVAGLDVTREGDIAAVFHDKFPIGRAGPRHQKGFQNIEVIRSGKIIIKPSCQGMPPVEAKTIGVIIPVLPVEDLFLLILPGRPILVNTLDPCGVGLFIPDLKYSKKNRRFKEGPPEMFPSG